MVMWKGKYVDVLSITGASPDALLVRPDETGGTVYAVIEAKSRVPFMKIPPKQNSAHLSTSKHHQGLSCAELY